jgi:hypothetical protein
MPDENRSVFFSHIHAERPIAFLLQRYIREA